MEIKVNNELSSRLMQESEAETMFQVIQENKAFLGTWLNWVEFVKTPENSIEKIREDIAGYASGKNLELGIFLNNQFIGRVGFHTIKDRNAEIGYWLAESENGKGIITESCKALIKYAFREMNLHRVIIKMDTENIPSKKVPERLGFTCEGIERGSTFIQKQPRDSFVYSLLKSDKINF